MTGRARPRWSAAGMIKAILGLQIAMGAALFAGDIAGGLRLPGLPGPAAPGLDQPVRPGDQTRRFRPAELRRPASPLPGTADMPERLAISASGPEATRVMTLRGAVAAGDAERVAAFLDSASPAPRVVRLDSPGGAVSEALEIGRALRAVGLDTEVQAGAVCLSACPYMLAAGVHRRADEGAHVGVHQHYFGEATLLPAFMAVEDIQRGQARVMAYLDEMGVDLRLMRPALETPPDEIYILVPEEMREVRLVTGE